MIKSWKHKGLKRFFEQGSTAGIIPNHANRLEILLSALNDADTINALGIPSFRLHPLTGNRKGIWSVTVSGNWRLTFEFDNGDVYILNYEDYH